MLNKSPATEPLVLGKNTSWTGYIQGMIISCSSLFYIPKKVPDGRKSWSWLGLAALKGMHPKFFRLEPMGPDAHCDFQFLRH